MPPKRELESPENPGKRLKTSSDSEDDLETIQTEIPTPKSPLTSRLPDEILKKTQQTPGKLLISGVVDWKIAKDPIHRNAPRKGKGKKAKTAKNEASRPNLYEFHRFTDETYNFIACGPVSAHAVLITKDYKALTMGINKFGQLGQRERRVYEIPTPVKGLDGINIISAATGRNHTLFLTDTGSVFACGDNHQGQCGIGKISATVDTPKLIDYSGPPIVKIGCGADFSVILDSNGNLYAFGLPEFGQLGNNTDGKYFITANRLSFNFETSPLKIENFVEKEDGHVKEMFTNVKIVDFAVGPHHTVAIDEENRAFSWGFGGYGRLGHAEQKDEWVPRLIRYFNVGYRGNKMNVKRVFCGGSYTLAIIEAGQLYFCGKNKSHGEVTMYPKPVHDLGGWKIDTIGCSNTSMVISAEDRVIAWGASPCFGELVSVF